MLNKDQLQEILRAKQGSQISKLYVGGEILRAANIPNMKAPLKVPEHNFNPSLKMKLAKFGAQNGGTINAIG
jgi:hypothetical protein